MTTKVADIRFRVEIKKNGIVVYKVRSSDDTQDYDVTVFDGQARNCTCPATKPCYHMRDVQAREDARRSVGTLVQHGNREVKTERGVLMR